MRPEIRRLAANGNGVKLPIPKTFTQALGWPIGTHIYIRVNADDTITLARVEEPHITDYRHGAAA